MANVFLDTNVIVYANDGRDLIKQRRAIDLVTNAMRASHGVVSTPEGGGVHVLCNQGVRSGSSRLARVGTQE